MVMKYVNVWSDDNNNHKNKNKTNKSKKLNEFNQFNELNKSNNYNQWIPFTDNHNHPIIIGRERDHDHKNGQVQEMMKQIKNINKIIKCCCFVERQDYQ
ncbi:endochitinase [Reticulomyxa filosa]|uniref:Endochitinase n=1 Tax=Reticulomyxa filosa TaxID=46433 RepID=X6PCF9_RETFI|nr:endochitinase [Reticulomyxa filosa]|eukprot:ETO35788.1 endochitinase [Reticulomyxa filosa]